MHGIRKSLFGLAVAAGLVAGRADAQGISIRKVETGTEHKLPSPRFGGVVHAGPRFQKIDTGTEHHYPIPPRCGHGWEPVEAGPRLKKVDTGTQYPYRPRLGIEGAIVPNFGMRVLYVEPFTAAERMGLEYGDVIVRINEHPIWCDSDYHAALEDAAVYHGGRVRCLIRNVRTGEYVYDHARLWD